MHLVLTKADKFGRGKQTEALMQVRQRVDSRVGVQSFSATSGLGLSDLQQTMALWMGLGQAAEDGPTPGQ